MIATSVTRRIRIMNVEMDSGTHKVGISLHGDPLDSEIAGITYAVLEFGFDRW